MPDAYIYDHVRTPRGRALAAEGYRHLGLKQPASMAQLELIDGDGGEDGEAADG